MRPGAGKPVVKVSGVRCERWGIWVSCFGSGKPTEVCAHHNGMIRFLFFRTKGTVKAGLERRERTRNRGTSLWKLVIWGEWWP